MLKSDSCSKTLMLYQLKNKNLKYSWQG